MQLPMGLYMKYNDLITEIKSILDLNDKDNRYNVDIERCLRNSISRLPILGLPYYTHREKVVNISKDHKEKSVTIDLSYVEEIRGVSILPKDGKPIRMIFPMHRYERLECCGECHCGDHSVVYRRDGVNLTFYLDGLPEGEFIIEYDGSLDYEDSNFPVRYKRLVLTYAVYDFCMNITRDTVLGQAYFSSYEEELGVAKKQGIEVNRTRNTKIINRSKLKNRLRISAGWW